METKYSELSKRDKSKLKALCLSLGIPIAFKKNREDLRKLLHKDHEFSNTDVVHHNGTLFFKKHEEVVTILHDIAHAVFLGPLYKRLKNGISDLADVRWQGDEEMPVMFLQVEMSACLKHYGGKEKCLEEMTDYGYGFSTKRIAGVWKYISANEWWEKERFRELKDYKKIPIYDELRVRNSDYKTVTITN